MGLTINNNASAVNASTQSVATELTKLSAGKRIVKAADDPAGLAIAETLDAMERALSMAGRNTNDGLSLLQTADGAASSVNDSLTRMKELAIQAASGTLNDEQRGYIQAEYDQIASSISQTAISTEFNGKNIGTGGTISVQTGSSVDDKIDLNLGDLRADSLSVDSASIGLSTSGDAQDAIEAIDNAISTVNTIRSENGASQNQLESSINNLNTFTENLSSAESTIRDADVAFRASEVLKAKLQQQANIAMQAQAYALTQGAVRLLG
jgi:flagellin